MLSFLHSPIRASVGLLIIILSTYVMAGAQAQTLSSDQARADLNRLYQGLKTAEANLFSETSKHVFDLRFAELSEQMDGPIHKVDLHAQLQRFAALARHSHTRIDQLNPGWTEYIDAGGTVFPFRFSVDDGDVIVVGAPDESEVQLGDRIIAFEGDANPIWLARLKRNISAETPALAYALMSQGEPYYIWLEYGGMTEFQLKLERKGRTLDVTVDAITLDQFSELISLTSRFDLSGRDAKILDGNIAYLRPGAFYNLEANTAEEAYDPESLTKYKSFIDQAFENFIDAGSKHLILDLRNNSGGDVSFSDPVVAWFADRPFRFTSDFRIRVSEETIASNQARLEAHPGDTTSTSAKLAALYTEAEVGELISYEVPFVSPREGKRFTGDVHVLVNRFSYSNAVTTAAMIQDYNFGLIYGEPTRDMATTFGAMEQFTLPHSGFVVGYPKAHIIRPNGQEKSHPVEPDVLIHAPRPQGVDDWMLNKLVHRITK